MEGDEECSKALARVCRALAGPEKFAEAARSCQDHAREDQPGCLDAEGVLAVLEEVAPQLSSSGDKVRQ